MSIDTRSLSQLITEFRAIQEKNNISPDSLGFILQKITDVFSFCCHVSSVDDLLNKISEKATLNDLNDRFNNIKSKLISDVIISQNINGNLQLFINKCDNNNLVVDFPIASYSTNGLLSFTDKQNIDTIKDRIKFSIFAGSIDVLPDDIIDYADNNDVENKPTLILYCKSSKSFVLQRVDTNKFYKRWFNCENFGNVVNDSVVPSFYKIYFSSVLNSFAIGADVNGLIFFAKDKDLNDTESKLDGLTQDFINLQNHDVIKQIVSDLNTVNETAGDAYTSISETVQNQGKDLELLCDADQMRVTGSKGILICDADRKTNNIIYNDLTLNLPSNENKLCPIAIDSVGEIVGSETYKNVFNFVSDLTKKFGLEVRPSEKVDENELLALITI